MFSPDYWINNYMWTLGLYLLGQEIGIVFMLAFYCLVQDGWRHVYYASIDTTEARVKGAKHLRILLFRFLAFMIVIVTMVQYHSIFV